MTQLLEQLKAISGLITGSESYEIDKETIERQISLLEMKLSDDSNYMGSNVTDSRAKLDKITRSLNELTLRLERNEFNISSDTTRAKQVDAEIEKCNELISQCEQDIDEASKELRALGNNPDKKIEKKLSKELKSKKELLEYLTQELAVYTAERENLVNSINAMTERNKGISSSIEKYQNLQKSLSEKSKQETKSSVNSSKKTKDEVKLSELKLSLQAINERMDFEQYASQEISALIAELESGSISENDAMAKVQEIISKLPHSLEKNEEELARNREEQKTIEDKISELEARLSDVENYPVAIELVHLEIASMEAKIANHDDDVKFSEYLISEYKMEISENESLIAEYEARNEKLQAENDNIRLMLKDPNLSQKEIDELNKRVNKNKKEIESNRRQIDRINKNNSTLEMLVSNSKKNKKEKENMNISDNKVLAGLKEKLEQGNVSDIVQCLKDKNKLASLKTELEILKIQEQILSVSYVEELSSITNGYTIESVEAEVEEQEVSDEIAEELVVSEEQSEVAEVNEVQPTIVSWKEASDDLINEVKKAKFVNKLKKRIATISLAVSMSAAAMSILNTTNNFELRDSEIVSDEQTEEIDDSIALNEDVETQSYEEVTSESVVEEPTSEDYLLASNEEVMNEDVETQSYEEVTSESVVEEPASEDYLLASNEEVMNKDVETQPYEEATPELVSEPEYTVQTEETPVFEQDNDKVLDNYIVENNVTTEEQYEDGYEAPESEEIGEFLFEDTSNQLVSNESTVPEEPNNSEISLEEQEFLNAILAEQQQVFEDSLEQGRHI